MNSWQRGFHGGGGGAGGLGVGENYVWCLVIVAMFLGLGGAKGWGGGKF